MDTLDRIKGSLLGGAAGDALGYPVEFVPDHAIRDFYGPEGITAYRNGQGWISDDTQMTLFTAAGILSGDGFSGVRHRVAAAYQDWLITQRHYQQQPSPDSTGLMALPQLYARRAPGLTCLLALETREKEPQAPEDYTAEPLNDSKGCGGVMRVAPLALRFRLGDNYGGSLSALDREGAQLAAITHGHSLGYMPAAAMTHILARIREGRLSLEDITADTIRTMEELYAGDEHLRELTGFCPWRRSWQPPAAATPRISSAWARAGWRRRRWPWPCTAPCGIRTIFRRDHRRRESQRRQRLHRRHHRQPAGCLDRLPRHRKPLDGASGAVRHPAAHGGGPERRPLTLRLTAVPQSCG